MPPKTKKASQTKKRRRQKLQQSPDMPKLRKQHNIEHLAKVISTTGPTSALLKPDNPFNSSHMPEPPLPKSIFKIDKFFGHLIQLPMLGRITINLQPGGLNRSIVSHRQR